MRGTIIVAMGEHREIGKNNNLLWHLPREMKFFKETTLGHTVIMGRKNWESIPKKFRPLANRKNIILTRNTNYEAEGGIVVNNIEDIPQHIASNKKNFIIGGAEIYSLFLQKKWITEMFVTQVHSTFEADTFFPFIDWEDWKEEDILHYEKDDKNPHSFSIKRYYR